MQCFIHGVQTYLAPIVMVFTRLSIAKIFWFSGLTKIRDWESALGLFKYEYRVPILHYKVAAFLATTVELTCPILLTVGLMTRLATLPMLFMTAVIQFTYTSHMDHLYWALILGMILSYGPGAFSVDALIKRYWNRV
ncbi:MAG TPA: DoxX family protein [Candidatus Nitrosotenuis sp.]|nr:DoxX family protein [Candidatus Nitrosotenuis sp.]